MIWAPAVTAKLAIEPLRAFSDPATAASELVDTLPMQDVDTLGFACSKAEQVAGDVVFLDNT